MLRVILSVVCMLGIAPIATGYADQSTSTPPAPSPTQNQPGATDKRADVPPDGVIRPAPDASQDKTVTPPNVDPKMTVIPPGAPGGNPNVVPK